MCVCVCVCARAYHIIFNNVLIKMKFLDPSKNYDAPNQDIINNNIWQMFSWEIFSTSNLSLNDYRTKVMEDI